MRLMIVVEGPTEEAFVNSTLKPYLDARGVYTAATIVGKQIAFKRRNEDRGGGHFVHWRRDIQRLLGGDRSADARVTTLFDLYGLPDDFPGLAQHAAERDSVRRCAALETSLASVFHDHRLIPYIQIHEFEALVLATLSSLRELLDAPEQLAGLSALEQSLGATPPEEVNDGPTTAPSKRLLAHIPGFNKRLHGPLAIEDAGLATLRARCPRFNAWVSQLEALNG